MRRDSVLATSAPDTPGASSTVDASGPAPKSSARARQPRYPSSTTSGINLKPSEIASAFEPLRAQYSPVLSTDQVGQMLGYSKSTVYEWAAKGRLDGCFRSRGKHMRFWRDRVLLLFFNGPEWNVTND